ncbi:MAG: protease complex subunit PrcB family protein [Lachnospiraceae bacterium]|nr:protease complex subunit PrcB family protein [Lachnospiraceae bacterium]MCI9185200.1 protease complex subunit PrcB family protein [Lachnospiraceae bacterium]
MRRILRGKMMWLACLLLWAFLVRVLTGCSVEKENQDKVRDLEFTVVGEADLPEELKNLVMEKKAAPFKLTYSNDQGLYIVVGYGEQATGGYSISVNELYLTENSIVIDTELKGPEKGEDVGAEKSYPYIVAKTEYLENPVIFQ